jgi:hypothetical protein
MALLNFAIVMLAVASIFAAIKAFIDLLSARIDHKSCKLRLEEENAIIMQRKMEIEHCESHRTEG